MNVERGTSEWDFMWAGLRERDPDHDTAAINPDSGEMWEYMSTWAPQGEIVHTFRHRDHPRTGRREYVAIPCSPEYAAVTPVPPIEPEDSCPF